MRRLVLVALAASMLACSSSAKQSLTQLKDSIEAYNHAYRWKNYERAASYLPADLRPAFIAAYEDDASSLHIEEFRVLAVDVASEEAATVRVRLTYTLLPDITVQKRTLTQHWQKIANTWILEREDDSIRELDIDAKPENPSARFGDVATPDPDTAVEVTGPDGTVLRQDAKIDDPDAEAPE